MLFSLSISLLAFAMFSMWRSNTQYTSTHAIQRHWMTHGDNERARKTNQRSCVSMQAKWRKLVEFIHLIWLLYETVPKSLYAAGDQSCVYSHKHRQPKSNEQSEKATIKIIVAPPVHKNRFGLFTHIDHDHTYGDCISVPKQISVGLVWKWCWLSL